MEPPKGWEWGDKKWVLDLGSKEWVDERMVQSVEVEIEGERWVSDLAPDDPDRSKSSKGKVGQSEDGDAKGRIGSWRRRRWVRMVRRKVVTQRAADDLGGS